MKYTLSQKAITSINECRPSGIIRHLASALLCSEGSVNRHIRDNVPNGDLTKKAALEVIQKGTGLKLKEILESSAVGLMA